MYGNNGAREWSRKRGDRDRTLIGCCIALHSTDTLVGSIYSNIIKLVININKSMAQFMELMFHLYKMAV